MTKIEKMAVEAYPSWGTNLSDMKEYMGFIRGAVSLMAAVLIDIVNYRDSILGDAQPAPTRRAECQEIIKLIFQYGQEQE